MKTILAALLLATSVNAGAVFAQDSTATYNEGLTMLETGAKNEFTRLGITDVDPMTLTLQQLAEIKTVIGSSEWSGPEMKAQIEKIISRP